MPSCCPSPCPGTPIIPSAASSITTAWDGVQEDMVRLWAMTGVQLMWNSPLDHFLMLGCSWQVSEGQKAPGLVRIWSSFHKGTTEFFGQKTEGSVCAISPGGETPRYNAIWGWRERFSVLIGLKQEKEGSVGPLNKQCACAAILEEHVSLIYMSLGSATSALCLEYFGSPRPEFNPCPLLLLPAASLLLLLTSVPQKSSEPEQARGC